MLLHNIVAKCELCNGSRLIVTCLGDHVIETCILMGINARETTFVPRITLQPTMSEIPFKYTQRQFPVKVAFAMTINKSQGQFVKYVGLDLQTIIFSHG
jgi:ATP-dependent DNA helicase PIF1